MRTGRVSLVFTLPLVDTLTCKGEEIFLLRLMSVIFKRTGQGTSEATADGGGTHTDSGHAEGAANRSAAVRQTDHDESGGGNDSTAGRKGVGVNICPLAFLRQAAAPS